MAFPSARLHSVFYSNAGWGTTVGTQALPIAFAQPPSVPRLFERWYANGTLAGGNTPLQALKTKQ